MTTRSVAALSSFPDSRREGRALAPGKGSRGTLSTCLWFSWRHWCQTLLGPRETARPSGGGRLCPVCTVWARRSEVACPTTWLPGTLELAPCRVSFPLQPHTLVLCSCPCRREGTGGFLSDLLAGNCDETTMGACPAGGFPGRVQPSAPGPLPSTLILL